MLEEPSVLDYLKAKLTPWRGPPPQIPPLETEPKFDSAKDDVVRVDANTESEILPAQTPDEGIDPKMEAADVLLPPRVVWTEPWPWRPILGLILAMFAQFAFEPPDQDLTSGVIFYSLAFLLVGWSWKRDEWRMAPIKRRAPEFTPQTIRVVPFLVGLVLTALTYLAFAEARFTFLNTSLWVLSIWAFLRAFWIPAPASLGWFRRLWDFLRGDPLRINITPLTVVSVIGLFLVLFFRLFRLDQVPPEMISDHAEKLLDVADILNGDNHVFFIRNTGREGLQMYLTAGLVTLLGAKLSFLHLKLTTTLAGLFTLPFIYLLGLEIGNRRVGLFAMVFAGIGYWPNVISRIALRFTLFPFLVAPLLYFLIRGLRRVNRNDFLLSGLALGVGLHGYSPFRIVPILVILVVLLFLMHRKNHTRDYHLVAIWGLVTLGVVAFAVSLPLLRFSVDNPDQFFYRMMTRMGTLEQPFPGPPVEIFLQNLGKVLSMPFWSGGEIWAHSVPHRPALDNISAALFASGILLVFARYVRDRRWEDITLIVSIPILMLPSALSLAFPGENPSLNRTAGAIIPVFLMIGFSLDGLMAGLKSRLNPEWGGKAVWGLAILLVVVSSTLNYDLVFSQYYRNYRQFAWNTTEIGQVVSNFAQTIGSKETVWVVAFPHWVDTRAVAMNAGFPEKDLAIWPDQLESTRAKVQAKLFVLHPEDEGSLRILRDFYPLGSVQDYDSQVDLKDFRLYFVPPLDSAP